MKGRSSAPALLLVALPALLFLAMVVLAGYFLFGPAYSPVPFDPNLASVTQVPFSTTPVPSTSTSAPSDPSGKGKGNGGGEGTSDPIAEGDMQPVPDPGSVRFSFTLPPGAKAADRDSVHATAPGDRPNSRAKWTRQFLALRRDGGRYEATLGGMAPGEHTFWVDIPGLGSGGLRTVSIVANEVKEVDLGALEGPCELSISAVTRNESKAVSFSARLRPHGIASFGGGRGGRFASADGAVFVVRCLPGEYMLRIHAAGYAPVFRQLAVASSSRAVSVQLEREARLSLEFLNQRGEPARERYVRLIGNHGVRVEQWRSPPRRAGKRFIAMGGKLDLNSAPLGRWDVEVSTRPRSETAWKRVGSVVLASGKRTEERFTVDD